MSTTDEQRLREALRTAEAALADIGDGEGDVQDGPRRITWTLREAERRAAKVLPEVRAALAQQAPTPAVLFESMSPAEQRAAGESLYAIWDASRSAKLTPATAEPAAPVDARDANARRYEWLRDHSQPGLCTFYLSVGNGLHGVKFTRETVDEAIDAQIAAIARQAAAPT